MIDHLFIYGSLSVTRLLSLYRNISDSSLFPPEKNIFCFAFFASLRFSLVAAEGFLLIYRVFLLFVEPREKAESIPELNFVCKNISGSEVEANNRQAWHGQKAKSKIRFLLAEALNVSV
jgi:hypothetical protein